MLNSQEYAFPEVSFVITLQAKSTILLKNFDFL